MADDWSPPETRQRDIWGPDQFIARVMSHDPRELRLSDLPSAINLDTPPFTRELALLHASTFGLNGNSHEQSLTFYLDHKGKVEHLNRVGGVATQVELLRGPNGSPYLGAHTHPTQEGNLESPPSPSDFAGLLVVGENQRAFIVMAENLTFLVFPTIKTPNLDQSQMSTMVQKIKEKVEQVQRTIHKSRYNHMLDFRTSIGMGTNQQILQEIENWAISVGYHQGAIEFLRDFVDRYSFAVYTANPNSDNPNLFKKATI